MNAVVVYARARLHASRSWIALALLVAVAGGAVLTALAGARRTESAYRRFAKRNLAADVIVFPPFGGLASVNLASVAQLPQVLLAAEIGGFSTDGPNVVIPSGAYGRGVNVPKLLSGRLPRAERADEVAVTYTFARSQRLSVGSHLVVSFFGPPGKGTPALVPVSFRVVGIQVSPSEFPPVLQGSFVPQVIATTAFAATYGPRLDPPLRALVVRLRHGDADTAAFEAGLLQLNAGQPQMSSRQAQQAANVQRGIHLQAVALWLLAAFLTVTVALVLSQLLGRQSLLAVEDLRTLRAVGMTRTQLWLSAVAPTAVIALAGTVLAVAIGLAASPLLPIGTARVAEPDPGVAVDSLVIGLGAVLIFSVVTLTALWPAWWAAVKAAAEPGDSERERPPVLGRMAHAASAPPSAVVGIGMALHSGRGRTAVPVRSSLAGISLAVATLVTSLTFGASLSHLLRTPRLYGWSWDAHLVNFSNATADEIALGATTFRDTHAHLGGAVSVSITAVQLRKLPKRVVGVVVLPPLNDAGRFGVGAMLTFDAERSLIPPGVRAPPASEAFVRFAPGVDQGAARAELQGRVGPGWPVLPPAAPSDLVNFGHVENLPLILAALLALLAMATLAHTLVTSVYRRGRDLAVLKTLGFVPAQVRQAVAWQATTLAVASLVLGMPLGMAGGRLLWDVFANQLGTLAEPVTPVLLLVLIPVAVVVANVVAAPPAFLAARTLPALVLRRE